MEEAPENGKESSHSAHVNGMNEYPDKRISLCENDHWSPPGANLGLGRLGSCLGR